MIRRWHGAAAKAAMRAGAAKGLADAAENVLTEARKLVPIEEGTLERSGATDVDATNLQAVVTFDTPYAVIQHENLSYAHDAGRTAKYLENARNAENDTTQKLIGRGIDNALSSRLPRG